MPAVPSTPSNTQQQETKIVLDWDAALKHLKTVKDTGFALKLGKPGNNPYSWWKAVGEPLEKDALNVGARTAELFNNILRLKIPTESDTLIGNNIALLERKSNMGAQG